ncbi:MAG: hypothetical protein HY875_03870 [Chloroflexi bacterium]|nr:hypothetical protein [Chloroflexota bacterium]
MKEYPRHRRLEDLAIEARDAGAILVLAHPFRGLFDVGLPEAGNTIHPRLRRIIEAGQVHAIEVENNGCTDSENHAARSLAALAAHVPVAGSDAHVPAGIGRSWTSIPASAATPDSRWLAGAVRGLYERTPWHRGSR